jgi:hypothetical protein
MDRLGAWEYRKSGVDGANAFVLYRTCRLTIDDRLLQQRAQEEGFESALNALRDFDNAWRSSEPPAEALDEWANRGPNPEVK